MNDLGVMDDDLNVTEAQRADLVTNEFKPRELVGGFGN